MRLILLTLGLVASLVAALATLTLAPAHASPGESPDGAIGENLLLEVLVMNQLATDTLVDYDTVEVQAQEGIVLLTGEVESAMARDRAAEIASRVRGVRSVVNQIEIDPPEVLEAAISAAVLQALRDAPATADLEVDAVVDDGEVSLTGEVESWVQRDIAELVARGVPGVVEVQNYLTLDRQAVRTDAELAAEIEALLAHDLFVDDALVDVNVYAGIAVLSGEVGSLSESKHVAKVAQVEGVTEVVNDLVVLPWASRPTLRVKRPVDASDAEIRDAITDALAVAPVTSSDDVDVTVEVDNGYVTLEGTVPSERERATAGEIAESTAGVWKVSNLLAVDPD